jgi:hypothetical protein
MDIDSGGERQAPHLGKHVGSTRTRHCSSFSPGVQSGCGTGFAVRRRDLFASKVACDRGTGKDTEFSADDVAARSTGTGSCSAREDSEVFAGTKGDQFIFVTELAVTFPSTKLGEDISGGRLSEKTEITVSVPTRQEER